MAGRRFDRERCGRAAVVLRDLHPRRGLRPGDGQSPAGAEDAAAMMRAGFLLAIVLILAAYANSLDNSFHFDDAHVIQTNLFIRSLAYAPRYLTDARTFSSLPQNVRASVK